MKASKLVVLVGGVLGILSFFLPLVSLHHGDVTGTVSAYQIVKGVDAVEHEVDRAPVDQASAASVTEAKGDLGAVKGIVLAIYVPALLLALIGGLGVARRRFGRGAGTLSLMLGLVGLGIAALLHGAAEGDAGIGLTLLLITGVAGVFGGVLALIKPERPVATSPALTAMPRLAA